MIRVRFKIKFIKIKYISLFFYKWDRNWSEIWFLRCIRDWVRIDFKIWFISNYYYGRLKISI